MKKLLYSLTALSLLVASASHAATEDAKAITVTKRDFNNVRIAVVDMYAIFDRSKEGAALQESIKTDMDKRIKNIQSLTAEFNKLKDELANGASTMSKDALEKRQKKLMTLQNEIQIEQNTAQTVSQDRAQEAQMAMLKKVETAIQKIAKSQNIDVVIAGGTLYVADRVDITQLVIDELDLSFKAPAKTGTPVATKK